MTVQEGPGGIGSKIINTNYPYESGLTAGTTKQEGRDPDLAPAEEETLVLKKEFTGLT